MKVVVLIALLGFIALTNASPTPKAYCDPSVCQLPDCLCSEVQPPGGLEISKTPQIVYLTFDDGITVTNYPFYQRLFNGARKNPNGAPISGTFFITHEYNDYNLTHQLWRQGHEVALHSITHQPNQTYWAGLTEEQAARDIGDQRDQLSYFARIPQSDIVGYRAPFLQLSGNPTYRALKAAGLKYDSTRPTRTLRPYLWPYTTDYDSIQDCQIAPCPTENIPGFWVAPLVDLIGSNGFPCAFVDTCQDTPKSADEAYNLLVKNFNDHRSSTKAPFGIYTHAAWLANEDSPWIEAGYMRFVDYILGLGDTYIVSISKGLDFVQQPASLDDVSALPASWAAQAEKPNQCIVVQSCSYTGDALPDGFTSERRMVSCTICPPKYPWLGNPRGSA